MTINENVTLVLLEVIPLSSFQSLIRGNDQLPNWFLFDYRGSLKLPLQVHSVNAITNN
jgi:hypothetical protein